MFLVLDGIDGAGKGCQRIEICKFLQNSKKSIKLNTIDFPNHSSIIYKKLIHPALHEEVKLDKSGWLLSFMLDQVLMGEEIKKAVKSKTQHFITDGYFTTTIAYQSMMNKYFTVPDMLQMAKIVDLPKPDLAIYIDVDPVEALKRKRIEEGHDEGMDIFERSLKKQQILRNNFKKMVKDSIFCKWEIVNGNASIDKVTQEIVKVLNKHKLF